MGHAWRSADLTTRVTLLATALVAALLPLIGTWHIKHATAAQTAAVIVFVFAVFAPLFVALLRGKRWSWIVLLVLYASFLVSDVFDFPGTFATSVHGIELALLVSPPVRRHVRSRTTGDTDPSPEWLPPQVQ